MSFDLTNKNIQDTFQNLLQKTGSDGRLYDLEGNQVRDLTIDGTLTANTYITSESITSTSSGSTAFGNSADDTHTFQGHITASGDISSSGAIIATSAEFQRGAVFNDEGGAFSTIIEGQNDTALFLANVNPSGIDKIGIGGESFPSKLSITGDLTTTSHITASGNISASGAIITSQVGDSTGTHDLLLRADNVTTQTDNNGDIIFKEATTEVFRYDGDLANFGFGTTTPGEKLHVAGNISSSGFIGNPQITGSYDFPGAIMGYNIQGLNVGHATYSLTTSYAVPDAGMHVVFVAPKSGIVEIFVQVQYDGGTGNSLLLGLSDNATYNAVASYYEQSLNDVDETDDVLINYRWVVPSLTAGTTYQYWLGAKASNTTGTPKLRWGGSSTGRYPDFIMKATALPSNTQIET